MHRVITLLLLILTINGCAQKSFSPTETVKSYYAAFDDSNFPRIKSLISDSLTIVEGDYTTGYSYDSFYKQFKWDSIFQTTYDLVELKEIGSSVLVTVSSTSPRYAFLKNNPLISQYKVSFKKEKISKIELVDYVDADFAVWEREREALVAWVKLNHPELDGFIHDLSMQGAMNYLKAIELYRRR